MKRILGRACSRCLLAVFPSHSALIDCLWTRVLLGGWLSIFAGNAIAYCFFEPELGGWVCHAPSVSITSPANGAIYPLASFPVTAAVNNSGGDGGNISKVDFYVNGVVFQTVTTAPYSATYAPPTPGTYTFVAVATEIFHGTRSGTSSQNSVSVDPDDTLPAGHMCVPTSPPPATAAGFTPGTFQVGATGAATYTIPIAVPPGTAGMEPKLALTYSSQAGNGALGVGWSLSGLSFISRCGRTIAQDALNDGVRVNAGVSYDNDDRYCLDGQRLVKVGTTGVYGGDGVEYRTERESFTKVISHGQVPAPGNGPLWFEVRTKPGLVMEYGNSADSRIEAANKSAVRVWGVNKIGDTKGNYISVSYAEDNANGDYRPTRVDYTGNTSTGSAPYASVQFSYADRTDINPIYVGGSVMKTQKRLTNIKTYFGVDAITDYRLAYTYSPDSGPSLLNSVTACSADGTSCLPPHSFAPWQTGTGKNDLAAPVNWGLSIPANAKWTSTGDINGDGYADLFWIVPGLGSGSAPPPKMYVRFSSGSVLGGFGAPVYVGDVPQAPISCDDNGNCTSIPGPVLLGDVNGDGRADLVRFDGYVHLSLSTGNGFGAPVYWGGTIPANLVENFAGIGDINGDGFADIVWTDGSSTLARFSTSSGFGGQLAIGSADGDSEGAAYPILVGDVNGDGRADVVTGRNVRLSIGNTLAGPVLWGPYLIASAGRWVLADLNGDGFADLIFVGGADTIAYYSNGGTFIGPVPVGSADCTDDGAGGCSNTPIAVGDFDGDGRADVMTVAETGAGNVRLARYRTADLITTFTNSLGASATATYGPFNNTPIGAWVPLACASAYTKDTDAEWPVRDLLPQSPLYLTCQTSLTNGIGGTYVTNYSYAGSKVRLKGGGFLGFRMVEETKPTNDPNINIKTTTTFRQEYPFQGLPTVITTKQSPGAFPVLTQVTNHWVDNPAYNAIPYPNPATSGKYHRSDLDIAVELNNDADGTALPTVTTTTGYDGYGNALSVAVSTGDGYSKTTTNTYDDPPDTVHWFLGRLKRSVVTSVTP